MKTTLSLENRASDSGKCRELPVLSRSQGGGRGLDPRSSRREEVAMAGPAEPGQPNGRAPGEIGAPKARSGTGIVIFAQTARLGELQRIVPDAGRDRLLPVSRKAVGDQTVDDEPDRPAPIPHRIEGTGER